MSVQRPPQSYGVCVGVNRYKDPSANLSGCVNDAEDWADLLDLRGFSDVDVLTDEAATKEAVLAALRTAVGMLKYRDRLVFTFSGHGSWVPDRSGDEADGRDEVLVTHDLRYITDDDLDAIFKTAPYGTRIYVVSDSCHSGSVNRLFQGRPEVEEDAPEERFLSPAWLELAPEQESLLYYSWPAAARTFTGTNRSVLISGCDDHEYSYDAWFGDRPNGAFTYWALRTLRDGMTVKQWHAAIREELPSEEYPQSPQLVSAYHQRYWAALS
jgi:hypothetical protein